MMPGSDAQPFWLGSSKSSLTEGAVGLNRRDHGWTRIVLEKPFGRDLESAHALNDVVRGVFDEKTVYRIDHYLGKETVQNILVFRFSNSLFEPVWNRNYIDYVEITAAETVGVENRAAFYEETGALRDMVANHLLQLLALTEMEPPVAFDADSMREQKVQVFRSIRPMNVDDVARFTARGQYGPGVIDGKRVLGYRHEPGVNPSSLTETYAAVKFQIENWRWAGVPFYIRTWKHLARSLTEIRIHLKPTPPALFASTSSAIAERHHHQHSAGRGNLDRIRREATGNAGAYGNGSGQLLLSSELRGEGASCIRNSPARLDAWRCNALYARRRSRGGVAGHYAD
jgi:glucose-6-phosphate 1-dehydrogenase